MPAHPVSFPNADGDTLEAVLDRPSGEIRATALFAHCFTCSKDFKATSRIAGALADAGIAVLRFDFTGLGTSAGDFADSNFTTNIDDLVAAAEWLEDEIGGPDLLIGHSLGGTAVLAAAADIPSARAIATIASPATPAHVRHMLSEAEDEIQQQGEAQVNLGGRPFRIRRQFVEDIEKHDIAADVAALRRPYMIFHAPLDAIVEIDNASELFIAAKHPKSFVSLDDADHLITREADARYIGRVLAAWANRYLPEAEAKTNADADAVIASTPAGGFRTDIDAAGHRLVADEPKSVGGSNEGPTPYDLLSAALGSCTTMTLQMYARRKKLTLNNATVTVHHSKVHATDCEDCETGDGKVDEFRREIRLDGDLDAEARERLVEIADRCPVHRTLHSEVKVRTELIDD